MIQRSPLTAWAWAARYSASGTACQSSRENSARPLLGQANYRGALKGLYLCGSGSHPGGGVTGLPGRNAARELLSDWRRLR